MADGDDDLELDDDLASGPQDTEDDDQDTSGQGDGEQEDDVDQQQGGGEQIDAGLQGRLPDQRPPSRRDRRIDTLIENSRQKDQQIADLNRRMEALLQTRSQPQGESREQRDARRQSMSPEDRMYDVLAEHTEAWGREKQTLQFGMADQMDKAAFDAKCSVNNVYQKRQQAVEDKLRDLRSKGMTAPREDVLRWVIGQQALDAAGSKEVRQQRQQAGRRVQRQQARPSSANGSDVRAERGRQTSRERRLENVQI